MTKTLERDPPMQVDPATLRYMYEQIKPHMWLKQISVDQDWLVGGKWEDRHVSRQRMTRGDDGLWRAVDAPRD